VPDGSAPAVRRWRCRAGADRARAAPARDDAALDRRGAAYTCEETLPGPYTVTE
jgi:hypothetical protein